MFLCLGAVFADGEDLFFSKTYGPNQLKSLIHVALQLKMNAAPLPANIWHLIRNNIGQLLGPLTNINSFTVAFSILISPIVLHFMPRIQ